MKRSFIKAFTLVELLVVIAILAILSTVGIIGYNSFTEKAYVSNDETRAELINRHLQMYQLDNPINSEDDLQIVIDEMYGEEAFNKLEPQSAKYGYHYWFNIETKQVKLSKVEDLNAGHGINYLTKTNRFDAKGSLRASLVPGFLLLDRSGSDIANALSNIDIISSAEDYENVIKNTIKAKNSDNDGKLGTILEKKLETTSIVSNDGTFRYSDVTKVDSIYYTLGTNSISSSLHEYDGKDVITSYLSNANIKYIANGVNFVLPSNIINVDSYSFYFDENNIPTLSTSLEESQLLEVFKANATNAIIEIEKDEVVNQYKFENGVLKNITSNVVVGTPSYSNPVEAGDFTIKCLEDNNGKVKQLDKLYVAYDQKTFNLEAEFIDDSVSSQEVLWSSQNSELVSIDLEGKATIESLPEVGSTYEVTLRATALAGGHYEEVTVFIVRPTQGNITLGETYTLLVNNLELDNTININYDGSVSTFDFTDLYLSYNINDVVSVDTNYEITTNGDLFEIVGNSKDGYSLNLKEFDGTQELTITVGDYLEKEFVVNVIDNSASPFELKFKNTDKYMYRLGNANKVSLSSLFALTEGKDISNKDVTFNIYDASKTTGDNKLSNIATTGEGFKAVYDKELKASTWENSTIQFSGSGVAIMEIGTGKLTTRLVVEVVDGKNVSSQSDLSSLGNNDAIIINDFTFGTQITFVNKNIYGNGFTLDSSNYISSKSHMIELSNSTIDNLIINGPVFPEVVLSDNIYYVHGIRSSGVSNIYNSYISGFRSPINMIGGTLTLDNTTLDGGVYSNLDVTGGTKLILNNVTTIQTRKTSLTGKEIMGAGIVFSETSVSNMPLEINGIFNQYNWAKESDKDILPTDYNNVFASIFTSSSYSSYVHKIDGVKYINTGIIFNGQRTEEIIDNRIDKSNIYNMFYANALVYSGTVYTVNNSNTNISSNDLIIPQYCSNKQAIYTPKFVYSNNETIDENGYKYYYDESGVHISIPFGGEFKLDLSKGVSIKKYSELLFDYSCDNETVENNIAVFNRKGKYAISYTVTDNLHFDIYGSRIHKNIDYNFIVSVEVSLSNIPNAKLLDDKSNNTIAKKSGWLFDYDYTICSPIFEGLVLENYYEDGSTKIIPFGKLPNIIEESKNNDTIVIKIDYEGEYFTFIISGVYTSNASGKSKTFTTSLEKNDVYYLCGDGTVDNKDTSVRFTYKVTGGNGVEISYTREFLINSKTPEFR